METLNFEKKLRTAVILAGGKSTRMGFDKQLIKINDKFLIEILVKNLSCEFDEIIVISNEQSVYKDIKFECDVIIKRDIIRDKGPLSGLYSALYYSSSDYIFLTACDMPYINLDYIGYMKKELMKNTNAKAIVSRKGAWVEPFYAFYSKKLISDILENIEKDDLKILNLLLKNEIMYVEESIVRKYSKNLEIFENLNTKNDINKFMKSLSDLL